MIPLTRHAKYLIKWRVKNLDSDKVNLSIIICTVTLHFAVAFLLVQFM